MRTRVFGLSSMAFVVVALCILTLVAGCFGSAEPEPTPEPTAVPEPTETATATAIPEPTPVPPMPVMPPLPPSLQQNTQINQPVVAQPVPTTAVRLITVDSPTPQAQLDDETPTPTFTPESVPDVRATETPTPVPAAIPVLEISDTPTPTPEPTLTPTPAISAVSARAILGRALATLADSQGHRQEMTLTYRITVPGDETPRYRSMVLRFDYVSPDLMEGVILIPGLTGEQEFISVGGEIYATTNDGYHLPRTMPMRVGIADTLVCNIVQCEAPDMARAPRIIQLTLDDDTTALYEIAAAHGILGYPHAINDPRDPVDVTYMVSTRDENIRQVRFSNVQLDRTHFSGFVEAFIGLGIDEIESISMDMRLRITELAPERNIAAPVVRPESLRRPEIILVDFHAGTVPQNPGPDACGPDSCGRAIIQFSRPVVAWGSLTLMVDGKGAIECEEGCSREYASSYMLFTGDIWIEPGDEIVSSRIFKSDTTVIADRNGTELLSYSFDPHLRALGEVGQTTATSTSAVNEPRFEIVNRYPEEDVVHVRAFDLDPNIVYILRFEESLGPAHSCPEDLSEFSMRKGDSVGDILWDDPAQDAAVELRGYFEMCRAPQSEGLLHLTIFDEVGIIRERIMAGGSESVTPRPEGKPGITNIVIQGYELNTGYEYEYELELPGDPPATCTLDVRRKGINTDNDTRTEFNDYLSLCLGVDAYFERIGTILWRRFGSGDWQVVERGWITE